MYHWNICWCVTEKIIVLSDMVAEFYSLKKLFKCG